MNSIQNRIEEIKKNGYKLDFNETFNDAFNIWKNIFGYGALAYLVYVLFMILLLAVSSMLPFMSNFAETLKETIANGQSGDFSAFMQQYVQLLSNREISFVMIFISLLASLMFPIIAGIVYMAYRFEKDGTTSVSYLFEPFNGKRFGNLFLLSFIYLVIKSFPAIIAYLIAPTAALMDFISVALTIFIAVGFSLGSCFVLFNNMSAFDAIKASFGVIMKQYLMANVLLVLAYIFGALGAFACGVGALFTMPLVTIMCYSLYKYSVGFEDISDIDAIGNIENS